MLLVVEHQDPCNYSVNDSSLFLVENFFILLLSRSYILYTSTGHLILQNFLRVSCRLNNDSGVYLACVFNFTKTEFL